MAVDAAWGSAVAPRSGGSGVVRPVGLVTSASTAAGGLDRPRAGVSGAAAGVLAQGGAPGGSGQRIAAVLDRLRQWVVFFVTALASVVFAIGGLRYLLANGDLSEIDAAKRAFKGAAVGYGIALLAQTLASILSSVVGGAQ